MNVLGEVCRVDIITSSQTFWVGSKLNFIWTFSNFSQKILLCTLPYSIHNSKNAFSSFRFTLCALFYLSLWFVRYTAATATFKITFPPNILRPGADLPLGWKGLSLGLRILGDLALLEAIIFPFLFWFNARFLLYYAANKALDRRLKWVTISILFLWRWELVIFTYNVWNTTLESIFQITRGQWGTVLSLSPGLSLVHGRRKEGQGPLDFEIWHFYITFLAKKVVFLVREGKRKFHQICPPWKIFYGWKNPLMGPL